MVYCKRIAPICAIILSLWFNTQVAAAEMHFEDHRSCSTCNAALEKSMGYLRKNFDKQIANDSWYAGMLNSFWGGFAFLIDGNSPKEAKICADRMRYYLETWAPNGMGYDGWFASMSMFYLSEYSLRYGTTPEIVRALEFGAKFCHKTRESEGGWFHHPRWGGPNYAIDISGVGCGYFAAIRNMDRLKLETGPTLEDVNDYVSKVCDGQSVAYGLNGRGGFALASASYILIGLTSSGAQSDPRVAGIGGHLLQNVEKIRNGHANGNLHHFAVAAALHRSGPEAYGRFAGFYLHKYFISNMADDGSIGLFPNDNIQAPEVAYADLKKGGEYGSTAILACMLMMTRPNAFSPYPPRKKGLPPNKDCFVKAQENLIEGKFEDAYELLANILPGGGDDQLIPIAHKQRAELDELLMNRVKSLRESLLQPEPADREDAHRIATAIANTHTQAGLLAKLTKGLPFAKEAKDIERDALKSLRRLRGKFGPSAGKEEASQKTNDSSPFAEDTVLHAGIEHICELGKQASK